MLNLLSWIAYLSILLAVAMGLLGAAMTFVGYMISFGVLLLVGVALYRQ